MLIASAVMLVGVVPAQGVASRTSVIGTSSYEYNGVASSGYLAWTVWTGKKNLVYGKASGSRFRVNASKTQGWVGGLDGSTLVYQQYSPGRSVSDIYTYDLATKTRKKIGSPVSTSRWEYDGSISGDWVLFARWFRSEDRKIYLYNTNTAEKRLLAETSGRHRFLNPDQVNGNYVTWEKAATHAGSLTSCDVYLYDITADTTTKIANPRSRCQYAASVNPAGTVYFARSGFGCGRSASLRKLPSGGSVSTLRTFAKGHDVTTTFALDTGGGTTDVYYDPNKCGGDSDIAKLTDS